MARKARKTANKSRPSKPVQSVRMHPNVWEAIRKRAHTENRSISNMMETLAVVGLAHRPDDGGPLTPREQALLDELRPRVEAEQDAGSVFG